MSKSETKTDGEKSKAKVAAEVCDAEFERFLELNALDIDIKNLDDEDRASFDECRGRMLKAMADGSLVIDSDGTPEYTPKVGDSSTIKFPEPDGAALMAMDVVKKGHDQKKFNAFMAAMTGESIQRFAKMKGRDIKVCNSIALLFLA